ALASPVRRRAGDPGQAGAVREGAPGGRAPAAATAHRAVPVAAHGTAVRNDDELRAHHRHGIRYAVAETTATSAPEVSLPSSWLNSTSQSRSSRGVRKWRRRYSFPPRRR